MDTPEGTEGAAVQESIAPLVVEAKPQDNATDLLFERAARTPERVLFSIPEGDSWRNVTAKEFQRQVIALAKGLVAEGVEPGDFVGIMCHTRYEWTLFDFAVWCAGAVMVPVYETSSADQMAWQLTDSGATSLILESDEFFERYEAVRDRLPGIENVWQMGRGAIDELQKMGVNVPDEEIERRRKIATGDDVATLIYTAGSTGRSKGCILTHSNFVELSRNTGVALGDVLQEGASILLFITLAHVFARFISVMCVDAGIRVGHQSDTRQLVPAMASFKPTFLLAVPRVFEKVYNSAEQKAESGKKGAIFRRAAHIGIKYSEALDTGKVPLWLRAQYRIYDRLVFKTIRDAMGGNVQWAVSGAGPLGHYLAHFYRAIGITVLEGYGLTETTAPVTVNRPEKCRIGSVGPALPGCGIRVAKDGEIEVQGIGVMAGYWHNEEATKDAFDDGWFRTGDLGTIDDDGFLFITGRKKELIITAGGKNVAPAPLEDPIRSNPLVSQVVVVGDNRPFISALVWLDSEMLPTWLENAGLDTSMSVEDAAKNDRVRAEIQRSVDEANTRVSRAESIRKFVILPGELSEESGHLTPKLSVKRHIVVKDFAGDIDRIYDAAPATQGYSIQP